MSRLDRLIRIADTIATEVPEFQTAKAAGRQAVTKCFMKRLRKAVQSDPTLQCRSEEPVLRGSPPMARLCFDFYIPPEQTAVEFALGAGVREFEKDLLKAILAKDDGKPIHRLVLAVRRGKMPKMTVAARRAMVAYVGKRLGLQVHFRELTGGIPTVSKNHQRERR